jgi:serine/threonine protein kinase
VATHTIFSFSLGLQEANKKITGPGKNMTSLSVLDKRWTMERGQFEIIQSLGSGATAEVFKARNLGTGRFVALKSFLSFISQDPESLDRLRDEIQILKTFNHPNVVKMYGEHMLDSQLCLELELVEGYHLRDWMAQSRNPLLEVELWILVQVARGLGAVHERGIIHRDLKPENILISREGDVKLSDFGLAKELNRLTMTRLGLLVGSLGYMAPEITEGEKSCIKSDLFSFGAIAYELLSGQAPIHGETAQAILKRAMEPVEPLANLCPYVSPRISQVVDQCLMQNREDRPESIWAVESELMGVLNESGLLPMCRELVVTDSNQKNFKEALQIKREKMQGQMQALQAAKTPDKRLLLSLANEFQRLFPEDSSGLELLKLLRSQKTNSWKHPIVFVPALLVLLVLLVTSLFDWQHFATETLPSGVNPSDQRPSSEAVQLVSKGTSQSEAVGKSATRSTETKDKKSVEKSISAMPTQSPDQLSPPRARPRRVVAKPQMGTLSFDVDEDVEIFVNNTMIPRDQLKSYQIKAGTHNVRMVKEGFDPISNEIEVRAGQTTKIRARGGA